MKLNIKRIFKAITWRFIASGTTFGLAMLFFGDDPNVIEKSTWVAIIESVLKILFYFFHEKLWDKVKHYE